MRTDVPYPGTDARAAGAPRAPALVKSGSSRPKNSSTTNPASFYPLALGHGSHERKIRATCRTDMRNALPANNRGRPVADKQGARTIEWISFTSDVYIVHWIVYYV